MLATYEIGRRLRDRRAALLAAAMLAASVLLTVEAHIAKTDAALLGATTAGDARARPAPMPGVGRRAARPRCSGWRSGVGVLIKGPITPMVAVLAALTLVVGGPARALAAAHCARPGACR